MPQARANSRRMSCQVCGATVGQIVPFCEWCGAKHSIVTGALILTGAICQNCGFQSDIPFARCPRCRGERRVICPGCGTALPVRRACSHCGLHFAFFDHVRRRAIRRPLAHRADRSLNWRKLTAIILILATAATIASDGVVYQPRALAILLAVVLLGTIGLRRGGRVAGSRFRHRRTLLPVFETDSAAEAAGARAILSRSGIDTMTAAPGARLEPPPLHRLMVRVKDLKRAQKCLLDHGFEIGFSPPAKASRPRLRLMAGGRRDKEGTRHDHD